jgi:quinohemoprotein ethanol dehydrogenase
MTFARAATVTGLVAALALSGLGAPPSHPAGTATIDQGRLDHADAETGNWLSYGRTYSEQRYSPLTQIDTSNAGQLGLAWTFETREGRGAEASPIVVDGVMYVTSAWSVVYALDARTGRQLWSFDPKVNHAVSAWSCCDVVNRGVAVWKSLVYVGTIDGRLVAINAHDGSKAWDVVTLDQTKPYALTGAPRVARGLVFIGNGGAEYGVRGFVSAYDAETGKLRWRFYTVPGDPANGPDHAASDPQMATARQTWTGSNYWKYGGGGTVWDAIVYDPELDQLYIGTGNGSPWDRKVRSPDGGDNLFLSSVVALKPETGQYLWHFQETPGESWDFTATQPIMLATLKIGGANRKVLMHAPKNGFFYVLDRTSGKFISGRNFVPMAKAADTAKGMPISWAYGLDANGRPLENPEARYIDGPILVAPSGVGAHNWQPMSYSPQTGLVYLPARQTYREYERYKTFVYRSHLRNTGVPVFKRAFQYGDGHAPPAPPELRTYTKGELLAWDPVAQKPAWRVPASDTQFGGTLATAGGLVFWGTSGGHIAAFDARDGRKYWDADAGMTILTAPMTYSVDGVQYVAVMTGASINSPVKPVGLMPKSRMMVYRIGGTATRLPDPKPDPTPAPPVIEASMADLMHGERLFAENCSLCHGPDAMGTGVVPDLRRTAMIQDRDAFRSVLAGALASQGMPNFAKWIKPEEADAIRAYLAAQAGRLHAAEQKPN